MEEPQGICCALQRLGQARTARQSIRRRSLEDLCRLAAAAAALAGADVAPKSADVEAPAKPAVDAEKSSAKPAVRTAARQPLVGKSPLFRPPKDLSKIMKDADADGDGVLGFNDLKIYLGDFCRYGHAEITSFYEEFKDSNGVDKEGLGRGITRLNPYCIRDQKEKVLVRKPGAFGGLNNIDFRLDDCEDCTILLCDRMEALNVDNLVGCFVVISPVKSSVFLRNCKDCTFWVACGQFRTFECHNCNFYLHTRTEPVIEMSDNLSIAPFCAEYPGLASQFEVVGLNPLHNCWGAIYDFTGKPDGANWRIPALAELESLTVAFHGEEAPAEGPAPVISHAALVAEPVTGGEGAGHGVANIPQTRPPLPPPPAAACAGPRRRRLDDASHAGRMGSLSTGGGAVGAEMGGISSRIPCLPSPAPGGVAWRFNDEKEYTYHEAVSDAYEKIDRLDETNIKRSVVLKMGSNGDESFHQTAMKALQALAPQVAVGTEKAKEARLVRKEVQVEKAADRLPVITFSFQMVKEGDVLGARIDFGDSIKVCIPNYKPKSYSCSAGGGRNFDITSKGYGGRASGFLHRLEVGDVMHTFSQGKKQRSPGVYVGIVAYGVGITEGLPLARCELEKGDAKRVVLIWSARNMAETWWPEGVKELQGKYPERFVMNYALSRDKKAGCIHGRVTTDVLRNAFDCCWGTAAGGPNEAEREGVRFSTTGTKEMMKATDKLYEELGYPMPKHALLAKPDHKEGHHAEEHHD